MRRYLPIPVIFFLSLLAFFSLRSILPSRTPAPLLPTPTEIVPTPTPAPPTPTPTPRPLTFDEMSALYGPCTRLPTLMYHHIEPLDQAEAANHKYLAVAPEIFRSQLQYLTSKGYRFASMQELVNFFNSNTPVPAKSILLTFDDGYVDFATYATSILNEFGATATLFLSTGLTENPNYISWNQARSFPSTTLIANHTWSHKNMQNTKAIVEKEITTADTQLAEAAFNNPKIFAYPYGFSSQTAITVLQDLGYQAAFTTNPGSILCRKQRFQLPRIRIGNSSMANYGF